MRRGLTLLELLLAVALLAGAAAAIVHLTRTALGSMQDIDQDLAWQRSADMTLAEIDRLLLRRDRDPSRADAVTTTDDHLRVRLATGATVTIRSEEDRLLSRRASDPGRLLLAEIENATFELDEETKLLTVRFESNGRLTALRTWELTP
tara:strand:- start:68 stop:514 length:447 start_codon:yes stop_codon:yes gene_type:complete